MMPKESVTLHINEEWDVKEDHMVFTCAKIMRQVQSWVFNKHQYIQCWGSYCKKTSPIILCKKASGWCARKVTAVHITLVGVLNLKARLAVDVIRAHGLKYGRILSMSWCCDVIIPCKGCVMMRFWHSWWVLVWPVKSRSVTHGV